MSTRLLWAAGAAITTGAAAVLLLAAAPARAQDSPDTVVNCVAWDHNGNNIGDNLFYVSRKTPRQTSVMPIGQYEITCTNLPSSPDTVRITPGPHTSLGALGPGIELTPGQTKVTHPTIARPNDDTVFTVTRR